MAVKRNLATAQAKINALERELALLRGEHAELKFRATRASLMFQQGRETVVPETADALRDLDQYLENLAARRRVLSYRRVG